MGKKSRRVKGKDNTPSSGQSKNRKRARANSPSETSQAPHGGARNWLLAHLADAVWSAAIGIATIFVVLPLDTDSWFPSLLAPMVALGMLLLPYFRRRWIAVCVGGLFVTLIVNITLPFVSGSRDVYLLRCSTLPGCTGKINVEHPTRRAIVYPVVDPLKWWVWNLLSRQNMRFRTIETAVNNSGLLVVNAPTERAMTRVQHNGDVAAVYVDLFLRVPLNTLIFDLGNSAASTDGRLDYHTRQRARILEWSAPIRLDEPGFFSAVGQPDDVYRLAREAVRADLQLRDLLEGKTGLVWESASKLQARSLREAVRDTIIASALLDRSMRGNVFSLQKLLKLKSAQAALRALRREFGKADPLYSAALQHFVTILMNQHTQEPMNSAQLNFDFRDVVHFEDEMTRGILRLIWDQGIAIGGVKSVEDLYQHWMSLLKKGVGDGVPLDPIRVREYVERRSMGPFLPEEFTVRKVAARLQSLETPSDKYDQLLFLSTHQTRNHLPKPFDLESFESIELKWKAEFVAEMIALLREKATRASPPVRDIVVSELNSFERIAAASTVFEKMPNAKPEEMFAWIFDENDPVAGVVSDLPSASASIRNAVKYPTSLCGLYDRAFVSRFTSQVIIVWSQSEHGDPDVWPSNALDLLWRDYGETAPCSSFVPGLMLLHGVLTAANDPRSQRTRGRIDRIVGADAGWLQEFYRHIGDPELYVQEAITERLRK